MVNNMDRFYSDMQERYVIGALMFKSETTDAIEAISMLKPADFYLAANKNIWDVICYLSGKSKHIDFVTVCTELDNRGIELSSYVMAAANEAPGQASLVTYAIEIKRMAKMRNAFAALSQAQDELLRNGDPEERLQKALDAVSVIGQEDAEADIKDPVDVLDAVFANMAKAFSTPGGLIGISSGFENIDIFTQGFQQPDIIVVAAPPSMGKELINSALVYMMDGTSKQIGEVMKGDKLASIDGKPSSVIGVYPQGVKDIYQVTFSDGRSVIAGIEHQWEVNNKSWKEPKILTTADVIEMMKNPANKNRLCIPLCNGEFGEDIGLTIDPYFLGALIGDGGFSQSGVRFSNPDSFILDSIQTMVGNLEVKHVSGCDYAISSERGKGNWLIKELKKFDLFGKRSHEKHIPSNYLAASRSSRLKLINGLMDTDGTIEKHGTMTYTTTSKQLANDFLNLVRSLGYWAKEKSRITNYTYRGEKKQGRRSYIITIQGEGMSELVTLPRKKERLSNRISNRNMKLTFSSIEKIGQDECTCIMVDHERSLFLTDDYIVTHNTTFSLNFAEYAAFLDPKPKNVLIFSLEMSAEQLVQKTVANLGNLYLKKIKSGQALGETEGIARLEKAQEIIQKCRKHFRIDDKGGQTIGELKARAKRTAMKMGGLDLIVVDYLHLIQASNPNDSEIATITKNIQGLKQLAKHLRCPIIVLSQLNRGFTGRPEMKNLLGSSIIEQTADIIFFLYDEDYQGSRGDHSLTEVIVAKNRMGETGSTFLQPELGKSRFADTKRLPTPKAEPEKKTYKRFDQ